MPGGDKVTPDEAPWILVGGSYAGMTHSAHQKVPAGVDWMHGNQVHSQVGRWSSKFLLLFLPPNLSSECCSKPGVFFAGYASSAVVEAILWVPWCVILSSTIIRYPAISGNILSLSAKTCLRTALRTFKQWYVTLTLRSLAQMRQRFKASRTCLGWLVWPTWMMLQALVGASLPATVPSLIRVTSEFSPQQSLGLAVTATDYWPRGLILQILWCFGSQKWNQCTCKWMGPGSCTSCMGRLFQDRIFPNTQVLFPDTSPVLESWISFPEVCGNMTAEWADDSTDDCVQ